jgi:hypothetical protein
MPQQQLISISIQSGKFPNQQQYLSKDKFYLPAEWQQHRVFKLHAERLGSQIMIIIGYRV